MNQTVFLHSPSHRRWRDLSKRSLLLGLVLAPVLPVVAGGLLLQMFDSELRIGQLMKFCGVVLAAADGWSLVAGAAILLLVGRWRGTVRRGDCLLLGAFLAFSLPLVAGLISELIDWFTATGPAPDPVEDFEHMSDLFWVVLSSLLLPFGTFGGWMFWRIGVMPASRPAVEPEVVSVFE